MFFHFLLLSDPFSSPGGEEAPVFSKSKIQLKPLTLSSLILIDPTSVQLLLGRFLSASVRTMVFDVAEKQKNRTRFNCAVTWKHQVFTGFGCLDQWIFEGS